MIFLHIVAALLMIIAAHAVLRRAFAAGNGVFQFVGTALVGGAAFAWFLQSRHAGPVEMTTALSAVAFGCELYLFFFTFAISSVSVALLLEGAGLSSVVPELADTAPANRIQRMIESKLLAPSAAGRPVLTTRGKLVLFVRHRLRSFFCHDT